MNGNATSLNPRSSAEKKAAYRYPARKIHINELHDYEISFPKARTEAEGLFEQEGTGNFYCNTFVKNKRSGLLYRPTFYGFGIIVLKYGITSWEDDKTGKIKYSADISLEPDEINSEEIVGQWRRLVKWQIEENLEKMLLRDDNCFIKPKATTTVDSLRDGVIRNPFYPMIDEMNPNKAVAKPHVKIGIKPINPRTMESRNERYEKFLKGLLPPDTFPPPHPVFENNGLAFYPEFTEGTDGKTPANPHDYLNKERNIAVDLQVTPSTLWMITNKKEIHYGLEMSCCRFYKHLKKYTTVVDVAHEDMLSTSKEEEFLMRQGKAASTSSVMAPMISNASSSSSNEEEEIEYDDIPIPVPPAPAAREQSEQSPTAAEPQSDDSPVLPASMISRLKGRNTKHGFSETFPSEYGGEDEPSEKKRRLEVPVIADGF